MRCLVLIICVSALCEASTLPPIKCGEIPEKIGYCLRSPQLLKPGMIGSCIGPNLCDMLTCVFEKAQWLNGNEIDKKNLLNYFDDYGKEHPEWVPAIEQSKSRCLHTDLPPQGISLNCPAYDVAQCIQTNFARFAQASQWSTSKDCVYPQQFVATCPFCPSECFAPAIPRGSCNACLSLPHSP